MPSAFHAVTVVLISNSITISEKTIISCYVILASHGKTRATQFRVYCMLCSSRTSCSIV